MARVELKVVYDASEIDVQLEAAVERALEPFGFKRWASGFDLVNGKRDVAFDKE